ncbi:MAG: hypothetical protein ABIQ64_00095 [Candidatus Saccharimonadales bacterium]
MYQTSLPPFQQEFEKLIGPEASRTLCAPTALFACAHLAGHVMPQPQEYVTGLDKSAWNPNTKGWSRSGLSKMLRQYDIPVVSWHTDTTGQNQSELSVANMKRAGYIASDYEESYLREVVMKLSLIQLAEITPVVVTVKSGFAHNRAHHAVVITDVSLDGEKLSIFDPDNESTVTTTSTDHFSQYIDLDGACSVVLTKLDYT